ncbi:MAG: alanine--tRNA ligase, partial [Oscillospiraceae bacterium]
ARHGTFFEMLGNFSFGDYFKHEATKWAWEFFTQVLKIPAEKLYVTIYLDDDEAFDIWTKEVGVLPSHISRLGKEDNFWEHGTGPCGPCSEIHYDRGEEYGCGKDDCKVGCDCDRYMEVWNLVFSQFDSDGNGTYSPLEKKNIDTGMGLERLACVMQGVDNLFEVDTVANIMKHISKIAGVTYKQDAQKDVSLRVITDHIRSTVFMIADGVLPSNEGRGYVLRRLLRRGARHGRLLDIKRPFLYEVVDTVIEENKSFYPELKEKSEYIKKLVRNEEESFAKTIDKGFDLLNQLIEEFDKDTLKNKILSGEDAFKLYDTFGFPIDLTREILAEKNMTIDEETFNKLMQEQKVRARNARSTDDAFATTGEIEELAGQKTIFTGYDEMQTQSEILFMSAGDSENQNIDTAIAGQKISLITKQTPFYATSGGQVADTGAIIGKDSLIQVIDVRKANNLIIHDCEVISGQFSKGEIVTLQLDKKRRLKIMRNHTCAHLLQAALINVLGDHVHQAGQLVNDQQLRFDFSHFEALTQQEITAIENMVNKVILSGVDVLRYETDIKSAKEKGAMALFGEKYGDIVRVCEVSDFSKELCGGTHIDNSAKIGLFKIKSESSVASGVRRIEAVTGDGVIEFLQQQNQILNETAAKLKISNHNDIVSRCETLLNELKEAETKIDSLTQKIASTGVEGLFKNIQSAGKVNYLTALLSGTPIKTLRVFGDRIREKAPNMVALLVGSTEGKATMLCVCGNEAVLNGAHAGKIVSKAAEITGGKGGGRADSAMAGINDNHKIDEAFDELESIIREVVG